MVQRPTTSRRTALKTLAAIGGTTLAGGAALTQTQRARATASGGYGNAAISSDDGTVDYVAIYGDSIVSWDGFDTPATQFALAITATLDDGAGIKLYETGATSPSELDGTPGKIALDSDWGGSDEALSGPGTSGKIETAIGLDANGNHDPSIDWEIVQSATRANNDPNDSNTSDDYGLPLQWIDASRLENTEPGTTKTHTITIASTYIWYASDDSEIFRKTFESDVTVEVTNEPTSASISNDSGTDGASGG